MALVSPAPESPILWLDLVDLDQYGVNRSDDDLKAQPGDLRIGQNVAFKHRAWGSTGQQSTLSAVRGGLVSRQGLRVITTGACAGAIYAIAAYTFADPTAEVVLTDDDLAALYDDALMALTE